MNGIPDMAFPPGSPTLEAVPLPQLPRPPAALVG
jgi:hypothetical protein